MFQIRTKNRVSPQVRLRAVVMAGAALYEAAARGDPMGPREVAMAVDINQQYIDILEEMENMPIEFKAGVLIESNEFPIRFPNIDSIAEWMSGVMNNGK
jgi:hypothetical protein